MVLITTLTTTIAAGTRSLGTRHSGERTGSTHGIQAASTIVFWMTHVQSTWSASPKPLAPPFFPTKTLRVSRLANTSTLDTSDRSTRSAAEKNGSSSVQSSGTDESGPWNPRIAQLGTPSSEARR
jgi:hypothetical protein